MTIDERRAEMHGHRMTSKYNSYCDICLMPIEAGERIIWKRGHFTIHANHEQCIGLPEQRLTPTAEAIDKLDALNTVTRKVWRRGAERSEYAVKNRRLNEVLTFAKIHGFIGPAHLPTYQPIASLHV